MHIIIFMHLNYMFWIILSRARRVNVKVINNELLKIEMKFENRNGVVGSLKVSH